MDTLVEVELDVVREYLEDDSDEFAGTVSESIVVSPALRHLGIIVCLEGGIVLDHVVGSVDQSIAEDTRSPFRHSGAGRLELT